ncbi:MAG: hypothetical protein M3346_02475 [Actinomycetota bacterium]|nr:hypothetical protein [Actinomycetota bacterium]
MLGFRLSMQRPPAPEQVTEGVVMRLEEVYEIDPARMDIIKQQDMPVWDTYRIVNSRWDHLEWMHDHFADSVISAGELEGD